MRSEKISIIVPCYNEKENIQLLVENIVQNLAGENIEIVLVDDGSTDDTQEIVLNLQQKYSILHTLCFSRNFGHQNAIKAGLDFADGDCVIMMDADLQHPPDLLPRLLLNWRKGFDIVQTIRLDEEGQSKFKKITSNIFYKIMNVVSGVHIRQGSADFRLIDRCVVDVCKNFQEDAFFWRGLIPWIGFNQCVLEYSPQKRVYGTTKYSLRKMLQLALTGITSFSILPLRMASFAGSMIFFASCLYSLYIFLNYIFGTSVVGWSSQMLVYLFFGSVQLIFLGIIGEYLGKIHIALKKRPHYVLKNPLDSKQKNKK